MENKTCGECKYHINECHCRKFECYAGKSDFCDEFEPKEQKVLTNGDRIRQMSNGAFAFMMTRLILDGCPIGKSKTLQGCKISNDCTNCLKKWLNAPAESEVENG